ncbi:response regulator [uncultured Phenylobacterium sp.]|uniref:response regulator n=1 Tax=uncultured Phenylobacterium sp. TaxID=349273 RepID=UPI0025D11E8E|nr:response regulator [uncultured Phenylobacterium sp.]
MRHPADGKYGRPVILLVEDDAALGPALQFSLQVEGYRVELMGHAEALLERTLPEEPFAIVTDLNLPGLSGIEALEALRRRDVRAPAILLTSQPTRRLGARAAQAGVMVLEKPILSDRLAHALKALWRD